MVSDRRAFGERLKRQRERAGVTLAAIAQRTKVSTALFAGLEAGDCSRWPLGLYARAYVRGYAEAIGLNADETVEEFVAAFGPSVSADGESAPPAASNAAPLRLSLVEEPPDPKAIARRAGLAATELLLGALIAAVAQVGFQAGTWTTVSLVIGYFTLGRLVGDDPLLYGLFKRARQEPATAAVPSTPEPSEVGGVGETGTAIAHS